MLLLALIIGCSSKVDTEKVNEENVSEPLNEMVEEFSSTEVLDKALEELEMIE